MFRCKKCGRTSGTIRLDKECSFCDYKTGIEKAYPEAYRLAKRFHEFYEQSAPFFGYETKQETKEFDPESSNGRLMAWVCFEIVKEEREKMKGEVNALIEKEIDNENKSGATNRSAIRIAYLGEIQEIINKNI